MSEWRETELGALPKKWDLFRVKDLLEQYIIYKPLDGNHGGIHPKGTDFVDGGIPFVMASDINNGKVDLVHCKFITKKQADSLNKGFSITDDVLLTHKASLGRTAIVGKIATPYIMLTPQVTYYRIRNYDKLNNKYLKYFFDSPTFQNTLINHGDSGSTRSYVGITAQRDLPVILPPLPEQKAIAEVLSSLDDKIDLLHRQNKTLEQMAQTLFQQWFVEEAGEDWEVISFEDFVQHVKPGTNYQPKRVDIGIPFLNVRCLDNGFIDTSNSTYITQEEYERVHSKWVPEDGDVLISRIGTLGLVAVITEADLPIAVHYNMINLKQKLCSYQFLYFLLKSKWFQEEYLTKARQSVQAYLAIDDVKSIELKLPLDSEDFKSKQDVFNSFFEKIKYNRTKIRTLESLRDTLLPKLMSGEIRIVSNG